MATMTSKSNFDLMGALASGLCLLHCVATPFIFVAHAGVSAHGHHGHHAESPGWWGFIDLLFLVVSLLAVVWAMRNSSKVWVRSLLAVSWLALATVIFNEKAGWFHLAEEAIYVPALSLVVLHLYNRRYCQCEEETCSEDAPDKLGAV